MPFPQGQQEIFPLPCASRSEPIASATERLIYHWAEASGRIGLIDRRMVCRQLNVVLRRLLPVAAAVALSACQGIGPTRLPRDNLDYARALSEARDSQTLLNIVSMRYGETPSFLAVGQVISSYTLESGAEVGLNVYPNELSTHEATALGRLNYSDRPTITFTPLSGEDLARTSIRPLLPTDILPLASSGLPIDVLFRLSVQSVGTLQNTVPLAGSEIGASEDFFELIAALRRLQERGLLSLRFVREKQGNRVFFAIADGSDAKSRALAARARELLRLPARPADVEVVYGRVSSRPNQVAMLTRPIFAILQQVGAEIEVPSKDIASGQTIRPPLPTQPGMKPAIVIHAGPNKPANAYVAVRRGDTWFWIDADDFDSKVAYSILQTLLALARGATAATPAVLSIPAG